MKKKAGDQGSVGKKGITEKHQSRLFRYQADIFPISLFSLLFLLDLTVFFLVESPLFIVIWFALCLMPKVAICSWNHHHQHVHTFRKPFLNRLLELIYTFQTGITTNAWVLHHNLGHHIHYLDQTKDESGWKRRDGSKMGEFEYTVRLALSGYITAFQVGRKHPKYQKGFLTMGVLSLVLLAGALAYNWFNALFIFVFPMIIGYVATCWHTYFHHAGLDTDDHYEASYNIMHKWYNIITGNLGYHTAHHVKQGVHWSKLPEFHEQIAHKIPPELYREPAAPVRWLPAA
ncbi:fatty acid desaturase [bacterium]|nr:fatty acid desaturase [bacterium]